MSTSIVQNGEGVQCSNSCAFSLYFTLFHMDCPIHKVSSFVFFCAGARRDLYIYIYIYIYIW